MGYRAGLITGILGALALSAGLFAAWQLRGGLAKPAAKAAPPAPAVVGKTLKEDAVNEIVLTAEAVQRLAIETAPIKSQKVRRSRTYGGEAIIPVGQSVIVSAPVGGVLRAAERGLPNPGEAVEAGQLLFELMPILTPDGRANLTTALVDAQGQIKTAETQVEAARIALERTRRVFESEAGSRRALDDAQAQHDLAEQTLATAQARYQALEELIGQVDSGIVTPLPIEAPRAGIIRNLTALPGQNVPSGSPLFEIADLSRIWIRVPVYVGDTGELDLSAEAAIAELTARPGGKTIAATPAIAPPSANVTTGTIDLFYELDNATALLRPGQRVAAQIPLNDEQNSLTIPWSAVLYDIHGGTWVYEQTADRTFVRRRVTLRHVVDKLAVLAAGPPEGAKIVTAGAAELFGTETGFTK